METFARAVTDAATERWGGRREAGLRSLSLAAA
jgi:hypothetical protein